MKELISIQSELVAPKNQYNSFGRYNYRSCEDILVALKPLLKKYKCFVTIKDDIVNLGDRFYVKATAKITNEAGEAVKSSAFAREDLTKKGMDSSQLTGSTSSYARKYALNGLFAIDDSKDADSSNTHGKTEHKKTDVIKLTELCKSKNISVKAFAEHFGFTSKDNDKVKDAVKNFDKMVLKMVGIDE